MSEPKQPRETPAVVQMQTADVPEFEDDVEAELWKSVLLAERTAYEYPPPIEHSVKVADAATFAWRRRCLDLYSDDKDETDDTPTEPKGH